MSKIICDVCGTSFPESATQCPICGCVKPADAVAVAGDTDIDIVMASGAYTYVKGGRFSKSNVRKRNTVKRNTTSGSSSVMDEIEPQKAKSDKGLVVAVILLLLAIIAVVIYIAIRFFGPGADPNENVDTQNNQTSNSQTDTAVDGGEQEQEQTGTDEPDPKPETIPCEMLTVSVDLITFNEPELSTQLEVILSPAETTDVLQFESDDESVATVTEDGLVTAVGNGDTIIRVKCGTQETLINVSCTFEQQGGEDPDNQTQTPAETFTLTTEDFSFFAIGESENIYNGTVPVDQITWTSSDTAIITVENGVVTAVGASFYGDFATITAEYNGIKLTCIARCHYSANAGIPGNGNVSES